MDSTLAKADESPLTVPRKKNVLESWLGIDWESGTSALFITLLGGDNWLISDPGKPPIPVFKGSASD